MSSRIIYDNNKSIQFYQKFITETLYVVYSNFNKDSRGLYVENEPTLNEFICTNISINDSYITFNENILNRYNPCIFEIYTDKEEAETRYSQLMRRYYAHE